MSYELLVRDESNTSHVVATEWPMVGPKQAVAANILWSFAKGEHRLVASYQDNEGKLNLT